jgi:hypothetical protein
VSEGTRFPTSELDIVQNPTLGAFAIWRFVQGFQGRGELVCSSALGVPYIAASAASANAGNDRLNEKGVRTVAICGEVS